MIRAIIIPFEDHSVEDIEKIAMDLNCGWSYDLIEFENQEEYDSLRIIDKSSKGVNNEYRN